jgi:TonB family protein
MPLLEEKTQPEIAIDLTALEESSPKQRRRMLLALALLLAALIVVLVKDRDFWFPSASEQEIADEASPDTNAAKTQSHTSTANVAKAKPKARSASKVSDAAKAADTPPATEPVLSTRAVLPPLEVEVVAGDQHQTIRSGNNSVKLDLESGSAGRASTSSSVGVGTPVTTAAERVRLSPGTAEVVSRPVDPSYPMLAKQMKVQGAVVLQVLIGKEGNIQNLQVLSGPAILSTAAREAVLQWRFKPYFVSGQPVETEARVTVNFTISTQ